MAPSGLTNSPGLIGAGAPIYGSNAPRAAVNNSIQVIIAATGVPQPAQSMFVPANCSVYVRGHNGQTAGNTAPVRTALSYEGLQGVKGDVITPDTEIFYPVNNTGKIWVEGTAGDGIIIAIRASSTE